MAPQEVSGDSHNMNKVNRSSTKSEPTKQGCVKRFSDKVIHFLENAFGG